MVSWLFRCKSSWIVRIALIQAFTNCFNTLAVYSRIVVVFYAIGALSWRNIAITSTIFCCCVGRGIVIFVLFLVFLPEKQLISRLQDLMSALRQFYNRLLGLQLKLKLVVCQRFQVQVDFVVERYLTLLLLIVWHWLLLRRQLMPRWCTRSGFSLLQVTTSLIHRLIHISGLHELILGFLE